MLKLSGYRVVTLCEDKSQREFFRGVFEGFGVIRRNIFHKLPADGENGGESFVMRHLSDFVDEADKNRENVVFVVGVDADTRSLKEQKRKLYAMIPNSLHNGKRGLFVFIPKRNIETWAEYCRLVEDDKDTKNINETTDYKRRGGALPCHKYGKNLANWIKGDGVDCDNLPALQEACAQFIRDDLNS